MKFCDLLLIHMSLCQINYTCKNCGFPEKFDKMLIIYKSIKMAIFTKNIPKHTDQSVCHNKKTLKTRRKQALQSVCLLQIFYIYGRIPPKNKKSTY